MSEKFEQLKTDIESILDGAIDTAVDSATELRLYDIENLPGILYDIKHQNFDKIIKLIADYQK